MELPFNSHANSRFSLLLVFSRSLVTGCIRSQSRHFKSPLSLYGFFFNKYFSARKIRGSRSLHRYRP